MPVISVKNLTKTYQVHKKQQGLKGSLKSIFSRKTEDVIAVKNISFDIEEEELVGFIGPNGAGKTTTLKCLSGLLHPTSGTVDILGHKPWERKKEFLKNISLVMGQKNQLWWDLPAQETFDLNKEIYEIPEKKYKSILSDLTEILDVKNFTHIQVRKLSLGQRMKMELIAALLHTPQVLFLDEPTIGLDVVMQKAVRDFIKTYNKKYNASIILTSHYMNDVKELTERVIMIDQGKIAFDGKLEKITKQYANEKYIVVHLKKRVPEKELKKIANLYKLNELSATFSAIRKNVPQTTHTILTKLPVADLSVEEMPIEEVIRNIFQNTKK